MKKNVEAESDITDLINKMQEKLVVLEQKIDILISKSSSRPAEVKPLPAPYQQHQQRQQHQRRDFGGPRDRNDFRDRTLYRAICAECKKECEVPFKPSGERPVYCKECFSKRRAGSSFTERPDSKPREWMHLKASHGERHRSERSHGERSRGPDKRKASPRKKSFSKKRKKY